MSTFTRRQLRAISLIAGLGCCGATLAQEDLVDEFIEDMTPDCISDDYVPDLISDTDIVQSGREAGILCQPVAEEEAAPVPEGTEVWDPHGIIAENEANQRLAEEMIESESFFNFESLLPASRFADEEEFTEAVEEEFEPVSGVRELILEDSANADTRLDIPSHDQSFDFDAEMAASRGNQAPVSLDEAFSDRASPSGPVELGDIHEARRQIALQEARERYQAENSRIQDRCQCAYTSSSCFSAPTYDYDQLNQTVATAQADLNSQQENVCRDYNNWASRVVVDQMDSVTEIDSVLGIARAVTNDLDSLSEAHASVLQDMSNAESDIAAEIRAEEQRRQQALAQQNSGPSGWQVLGQAMQQVGAEMGEIYAEAGGALIQDIASGGNTSALAQLNQKYSAGNYNYGSNIQVTDYGAYEAYTVGGTAGYDASAGSNVDQLMFGSQQNTAAYGTTASPPDSGSASGQYGIALYSIDKTSNWVYILSSQPSSTHAYANSRAQCGSVCSGPVLHVEFGPGQCIAFGAAQDDRGSFRRSYEISSSLAGARNAVSSECETYYRDKIQRGEDIEYSCSVVASACN